eukprot:TRINITY_DN50434_c0_g1_i1.p1 TRINITY_DN50434_c0_g1~~TRINITY_DN50434_c0_g1_i1.p1  ORF type:complete len:283 (+),score=19.96 TRINITY_DN50434_c0_g1_i1:84-932(+)
MSGRGGAAYLAWDAHDSLLFAKDPRFSLSQHHREGKPWWVSPRDPFTHGFKCDLSEFFSTKRRLTDSPGTVIQYAAAAGAMQAATSFVNIEIASNATDGAKQKDMRTTHVWAMKRLSTLRIFRSSLMWAGVTASYFVPREMVSQNWGRRNQRNHFDAVPHLAGCAGLWLAQFLVLGAQHANSYLPATFVLGTAYLFAESQASLNMDSQREVSYPIQLAHMYGLPFGGEGFDLPAGGETQNIYRMESETERGFQMHNVKVRQTPMADVYPPHQSDWGHTSYSY